MLCLPDGAEIDAVQVDVDRPGVLLFRIHGAGWPVHNGATIPRATCQIRQRTMCDGEGFVTFVERIEWGLSEALMPTRVIVDSATSSRRMPRSTRVSSTGRAGHRIGRRGYTSSMFRLYQTPKHRTGLWTGPHRWTRSTGCAYAGRDREAADTAPIGARMGLHPAGQSACDGAATGADAAGWLTCCGMGGRC